MVTKAMVRGNGIGGNEDSGAEREIDYDSVACSMVDGEVVCFCGRGVRQRS